MDKTNWSLPGANEVVKEGARSWFQARRGRGTMEFFSFFFFSFFGGDNIQGMNEWEPVPVSVPVSSTVIAIDCWCRGLLLGVWHSGGDGGRGEGGLWGKVQGSWSVSPTPTF